MQDLTERLYRMKDETEQSIERLRFRIEEIRGLLTITLNWDRKPSREELEEFEKTRAEIENRIMNLTASPMSCGSHEVHLKNHLKKLNS